MNRVLEIDGAFPGGNIVVENDYEVPRMIAFSRPTVPARVFVEPRHLTLPQSKPLSWSSPFAIWLPALLSGDALC